MVCILFFGSDIAQSAQSVSSLMDLNIYHWIGFQSQFDRKHNAKFRVLAYKKKLCRLSDCKVTFFS